MIKVISLFILSLLFINSKEINYKIDNLSPLEELELYEKGGLEAIYSRCQRGSGRDCLKIGIVALNKRNYKEALNSFKRSCSFKYPLGCFNLALLYKKGLGVKRDLKEALRYFKLSCSKDINVGCKEAAQISENLKDQKSVLYYLKLGCKYNCSTSCQLLGDKLVDKKEKLNYYLKSCKLGNGEGCAKAGSIYEDRGNRELAKRYYQLACQLNSGNGCGLLGDLIIDKNSALALKHYKKACSLGYGRGCTLVGILYKEGKRGVKGDKVKSKEFFLKGCKERDGEGCNEIGYSYIAGDSKNTNYERAFKYFLKGCKLGSIESCKNGVALIKEGIVDSSSNQVLELYKRACELGDGESCFNVANFYKKEKKIGNALKYYQKSCDLLYDKGCEEEDKIEKEK